MNVVFIFIEGFTTLLVKDEQKRYMSFCEVWVLAGKQLVGIEKGKRFKKRNGDNSHSQIEVYPTHRDRKRR